MLGVYYIIYAFTLKGEGIIYYILQSISFNYMSILNNISAISILCPYTH